MRQKRKCRYCGAYFLTWDSEIRRGGGIYCSTKCYHSVPQPNTLAALARTRGFSGRKHSEEAKQKIREAREGKYIGEYSGRWKGGRIIKYGYVLIHLPLHPRADKTTGYVPEHILIVEQIIGREIKLPECIHHINKDRSDNRPENLMCFTGNPAHRKMHKIGIVPESEIIFDGRKE